MPLYWTIDSRAELVFAEAEGDVSIGDAMTFLRTISGAKVTHYRKLFDGRNGTSSMSAQELLMITAEIRSHHAGERFRLVEIGDDGERADLAQAVMRADLGGDHEQLLRAHRGRAVAAVEQLAITGDLRAGQRAQERHGVAERHVAFGHGGDQLSA